MTVLMFPGQGSQKVGMGAALFEQFPSEVATADRVLGYSIAELCLRDPDDRLRWTAYAQPALFVVHVLSYLEWRKQHAAAPEAVLGHSLGEYGALFAAGAFDLETGLRLVKKRGELFQEITGGAMAAVVGLREEEVEAHLRAEGLTEVDVANVNSDTQIVISGLERDVLASKEGLERRNAVFVRLQVSGPFHSRWMKPAARAFQEELSRTAFRPPAVPVIANLTARPYTGDAAAELLGRQIAEKVRWADGIHYLLANGASAFEELGPGRVLTRLQPKITAERKGKPLPRSEPLARRAVDPSPPHASSPARAAAIPAERPPRRSFCDAHSVRLPYVAGSVEPGVGSAELVRRLAQAGLLGTLDLRGDSVETAADEVRRLQGRLEGDRPYAVGLAPRPWQPDFVSRMVDELVALGVKTVEVSKMPRVTPAIVRFVARGLLEDGGRVVQRHRVIARVSSLAAAAAFLRPAPPHTVRWLLDRGLLTEREAERVAQVPVASDVCLEVETAAGMSLLAHLPRALELRDQSASALGPCETARIGVGGGIGTSEAVRMALRLGAEFVLTDCLHQCTIEAGTSELAKDLLEAASVEDFDLAPDGALLELGGKTDVLGKGTSFPGRARYLHALFLEHRSVDALPRAIRRELEVDVLRAPLREVVDRMLARSGEGAAAWAARDLALVCRWYSEQSAEAARVGAPDRRIDFQIRGNAAVGAFQGRCRGSSPGSWRQRHADDLATQLFEG